MPPQTSGVSTVSKSTRSGTASDTVKKTSWYIRTLSFYNRHFPTDKKTYNIRLPVLGQVLSIVSLQIVTDFLWIRFFIINDLIPFAYLVLTTAAACQLYWGLKIGDRKQYTPWIIVKVIEVIFTVSALINGIYIFRYHFEKIAWQIVFGFFITFANVGVVYVVVSKCLKYVTKTATHRITDCERPAEENIYDFPQVPRDYNNV